MVEESILRPYYYPGDNATLYNIGATASKKSAMWSQLKNWGIAPIFHNNNNYAIKITKISAMVGSYKVDDVKAVATAYVLNDFNSPTTVNFVDMSDAQILPKNNNPIKTVTFELTKTLEIPADGWFCAGFKAQDASSPKKESAYLNIARRNNGNNSNKIRTFYNLQNADTVLGKTVKGKLISTSDYWHFQVPEICVYYEPALIYPTSTEEITINQGSTVTLNLDYDQSVIKSVDDSDSAVECKIENSILSITADYKNIAQNYNCTIEIQGNCEAAVSSIKINVIVPTITGDNEYELRPNESVKINAICSDGESFSVNYNYSSLNTLIDINYDDKIVTLNSITQDVYRSAESYAENGVNNYNWITENGKTNGVTIKLTHSKNEAITKDITVTLEHWKRSDITLDLDTTNKIWQSDSKIPYNISCNNINSDCTLYCKENTKDTTYVNCCENPYCIELVGNSAPEKLTFYAQMDNDVTAHTKDISIEFIEEIKFSYIYPRCVLLNGDVNCDGNIDENDIKKLEDIIGEYTNYENRHCDLNNDGIIDGKDLNILRNYIDGNIDIEQNSYELLYNEAIPILATKRGEYDTTDENGVKITEISYKCNPFSIPITFTIPNTATIDDKHHITISLSSEDISYTGINCDFSQLPQIDLEDIIYSDLIKPGATITFSLKNINDFKETDTLNTTEFKLIISYYINDDAAPINQTLHIREQVYYIPELLNSSDGLTGEVIYKKIFSSNLGESGGVLYRLNRVFNITHKYYSQNTDDYSICAVSLDPENSSSENDFISSDQNKNRIIYAISFINNIINSLNVFSITKFLTYRDKIAIGYPIMWDDYLPRLADGSQNTLLNSKDGKTKTASPYKELFRAIKSLQIPDYNELYYKESDKKEAEILYFSGEENPIYVRS